jgi:hypothetical protein
MTQVQLLLLGWLAGAAALAAAPGQNLAHDRTGEVTLDSRTPYFSLESSVSVGGKGEESLDVSVDADCGEPAWLFDRAELVVRRNRFGDVQFVGLPRPACVKCAPVQLRWFHEPTGYLSFEVNVYRRLEIASCSD